MKTIKQTLLSGAMMLALSLAFTSCDELIGELDNLAPSPVAPTPEPEPTPTVNVTGISLDQSLKVLISGGTTLTITPTITPSDATDKTITWTTNDDAVATVVDGVVTPVGKGLATITAQAGDKTATCEIFVGEEVDLSTKTANYPANNFDILTEALNPTYFLSIPDGYKVAFAGLSTTKTVRCSGDATIFLVDGSTNTVDVSATNYDVGILVGGQGTTLTINGETAGTGSLTAKGGYDAAGIGTQSVPQSDITCGNIIINGGKVTAIGGLGGAGIGTGSSRGGRQTCGDITINGGTVNSTGGDYAAGIGTGLCEGTTGSAYQTCHNIKINGGTVNSTGGIYAAGIGTGFAYTGGPNAYQVCGTITLESGVTSVTATKGSSISNSIGKGDINGNSTQTIGTVTIGGDATTYAGGVTTSPFTYEP